MIKGLERRVVLPVVVGRVEAVVGVVRNADVKSVQRLRLLRQRERRADCGLPERMSHVPEI